MSNFVYVSKDKERRQEIDMFKKLKRYSLQSIYKKLPQDKEKSFKEIKIKTKSDGKMKVKLLFNEC